MNINIPQTYFSKLMRAVVEFELIDNGDRILIGVSGGKDSIFLTYALAILRERLKKDFIIAAFTVNPQFDDPFDTDAIAAFCKSLDVPYEVVDVDIAGAIAESFTSYYRAYQGKREKATEAKADTTKATDPPSPPPHEPYCKEPVVEPTEVAIPTPQKQEKGKSEKSAKEEKGKNEKDKKEKAEATPTKQKGLTYRVQFLTSPKKLEPTDASFRHLPTAVERAKAGQQFIYLLQPTPSLEKAREQLRQLPPVYRDAFIVRYKDGVRQKG